MSWTMIIFILINGYFNSDAKIYQLQFKDKSSCLSAAHSLKSDIKGIAFTCVSSETGEVVRLRD